MELAATFNAIDEFKIQHNSTQYGESYRDRLAYLKIRSLKRKRIFRKLKQIFNQTMINK